MTLSEKITYYRKSRGWSQEDLAEQLDVSRQSVSKWESAASVPELDKIILLAKIFEVRTDDLLLDSQEAAIPEASVEAPPEVLSRRRLTNQEGRDYLDLVKRVAPRFALAVAACVFSPTPLILLAGISQRGTTGITENVAGGLGVTILLVIVAAAVAVFISQSMALSRYGYISKEPFLPERGLSEWAQQEKDEYRPVFTRNLVIGVMLCILGVVPLILAATAGLPELVLIITVDILLWMVAIAVLLFVGSGMIYNCYNQLLQQEDYTPGKKRVDQQLGGIYWCVVTAIYLAVSFLTGRWASTWIIWPVAGVLYASIVSIVKWRMDRRP